MIRPTLLVAAVGLCAGLAVAADRGPAALPHPESPTAWACSTKTLETATDCLLDAETPPATNPAVQALENVKQAQALAARLCRPSARVSGEPKPDEELYATCQRELSAAAEGFCSLDGETSLLDSQGRFALQARACYAALDDVLRRTRLQASLGVRCCRCLEKSCGVSRAACATDVSEGDLSDDAIACVAKKRECARACTLIAPPTGTAPATAPERPANRTHFQWL